MEFSSFDCIFLAAPNHCHDGMREPTLKSCYEKDSWFILLLHLELHCKKKKKQEFLLSVKKAALTLNAENEKVF